MDAPTLVQNSEWGVSAVADESLGSSIAADEKTVGRGIQIVNSFVSWSLQESTQKSVIDRLRAVSTPDRSVMITWEPNSDSGASATASSPTLISQIAGGSRDGEITTFLSQLADFPGPVLVRFAHEMNGNWYEWAGEPATYKSAWSRIHSLISTTAPQVKMVWSVNNSDRPAENRMENYWPGASQVDVIGLDGYNCLSGWQSPQTVFQESYERVAALDADAPIWITETASCEASSMAAPDDASKPRWIAQLFALTSVPRISAVIWFDRKKEFDWRIDSSPQSADALRTALKR